MKMETPQNMGPQPQNPHPNGAFPFEVLYRLQDVDYRALLVPMRVQVAFKALTTLDEFRAPAVIPGEGGIRENHTLTKNALRKKEQALYDSCLTVIQQYVLGEDNCDPVDARASSVVVLSPGVLQQLNANGFALTAPEEPEIGSQAIPGLPLA